MRTTTLALAAALLAAPGCRDVAQRAFKPPRAEFVGVNVNGIGVGGGSLDVLVRLHNDNPYSLTSEGARYRVFVDDSIEVGHGASTDVFTVAPHDSADARLPIEVSWQGLGRAGQGAVRSGRIEYRVLGELDARTPVGRHTFPVDTRGRAKAPKLFR